MLHTIDRCCTVTPMVNNKRVINRAIATEFVSSVNSKTFCAYCGKQPIEWHHADHPNQPNARVSSLRTQGASITRIQLEMDRCTPLCRTCHMIEDNRMANLTGVYKKGVIYVGPKPCICCSRSVRPTRRGMCTGCYNHHQGLRVRKRPNGCGCVPPDHVWQDSLF